MKKYLLVIISTFCLLLSGVVTAKHFWRGTTLSKTEVGQKWGKAPFQAKAFKGASEEQRALMAYSILENQKQFKGRDRTEIRELLGNFDGFYFSDMFPTYMIESAKSARESSWQIVFLLDRNEKVSEVIVHKNCCD